MKEPIAKERKLLLKEMLGDFNRLDNTIGKIIYAKGVYPQDIIACYKARFQLYAAIQLIEDRYDIGRIN